jgi:hypothetical protein
LKSKGNLNRSVKSPGGIDRPRTHLSALKARVKVRGFSAIDQRTVAARALLQWRRDLLADLGGEPQVSAAQLALCDIAARTRLYLDHIDAHLMALPTLINRRKKLLVEQRQRVADSLVRTLSALGLERRAPKVPTLDEYLQRRGSLGSAPEVGQAVPGGVVPAQSGEGPGASDGAAETPLPAPEARPP